LQVAAPFYRDIKNVCNPSYTINLLLFFTVFQKKKKILNNISLILLNILISNCQYNQLKNEKLENI
jgi:hypothetical protein